MTQRGKRSVVLILFAAMLAGLAWLDQNRAGPATDLSRCNLALSKADKSAADILIVGSSRSGVAIDPLAIENMLRAARPEEEVRVERLALGHNPMRAGTALLENYLQTRGAPDVVALELMFMTERSVRQLEKRGINVAAEHYVFTRDMNLLDLGQILTMQSVAMPFTEPETLVNQWRFRLRGALQRASALTYQFFRNPLESHGPSSCSKDSLIREASWPANFSFTYGDYLPGVSPAEAIEALQLEVKELAPSRTLKAWQQDVTPGSVYPYQLDQPYRDGELALFRETLDLLREHDVSVVLLPLPLYGNVIGEADQQLLTRDIAPEATLFDVYAETPGELEKFWYDDAHVEKYPAGALTSALLANYLLKNELVDTASIDRQEEGND